MPLILADRVRDTTTTTGTGTVTLSGTAPTGYQNFSVIGNGNTTYYTINAGSQWEVGIGTYSSTGPTLSRDTVLESSNANALVDFAAGTKDVFVTYPADKSVNYDENNNVGIGTTAPADRLDIASGSLRFSGTGQRILGDMSSGTFTDRLAFQTITTNSATNVHAIPNGSATQSGFKAESDPTFANGQFVAMDIVGGSDARFNSSIRGTGSYVPMTFWTSASERLRIDTSGNVGIGTTAPVSAFGRSLHVFNDANTGTVASNTILVVESANRNAVIDLSGSASSTNSVVFSDTVGTGLASIASEVANQNLLFRSGGTTERMRIDSSGNLLVGTTSNPDSARMVVSGGSITHASTQLNMRPGTATQYEFVNRNGAGFDFYVNNASNLAARIDASGNVGIGTTAGLARLRVAAGGTVTVPKLGDVTNYPAFISNPDPSYGLGIGVNPGDGRVWLQSQRSDTSVAYNLTLNEAGGNVGIGTTSPGVRLDVAGSVRVSNTQSMQFRNAAGTGVAYFTLQSDDNFVVYNAAGTPISSFTQGATNIAIYGSNGNNRMQVDSINNVTSWNVNGSERVRINSSGEFLVGTSSGGRTVCINSTDNWIRQQNASRSWLIGMGTAGAYNIFDETGGGTRLAIDTSGNWFGTNAIILGGGFNFDNRIEVGQGRTGNNFAYIDLIGDTTYTDFGLRLLRGNGGANTFSQLYHRGTGDFAIGNVDAAALTFRTSDAERMRITSAGNVGIGTSSPTGRLDILSTAAGGAAYMRVANGSGAADSYAAISFDPGNNGFNVRDAQIRAINNGSNAVSLTFLVANGDTPNEAMRISPARNVGIGTSSPAERLSVNSAAGSGAVGSFTNTSAGSSLGGVVSSINAGGNNTNSYHYIGVTQTVAIWYLYGNGTTSYTSDIRVKKNVETTRDGYLDDVCKLRVVKYNWYNDSDDTPRELGFIAQEVEQVFPGLVQDAMHPTKDGVCHKVLKGSVMMPIMLKALQEANEKIDALAARVAQLEGN
jgi:hypothetical protein